MTTVSEKCLFIFHVTTSHHADQRRSQEFDLGGYKWVKETKQPHKNLRGIYRGVYIPIYSPPVATPLMQTQPKVHKVYLYKRVPIGLEAVYSHNSQPAPYAQTTLLYY